MQECLDCPLRVHWLWIWTWILYSVTGGFKWRTQKEALDEGVDLVIATPGRLGEHIKAGTLKLHHCQAVVLDEADVLLGDAYAFSQQVCFCSISSPAHRGHIEHSHCSNRMLKFSWSIT